MSAGPRPDASAPYRDAARPAEARRVGFAVPGRMLSFTGPGGGRILEPGAFELTVGASSGDIRLRTSLTPGGKTRVLGPDWRMESRSLDHGVLP